MQADAFPQPQAEEPIPPAEPVLETDTVRAVSITIAGMGIALGVVGNLFFYDQGLGVNVFLYVLIFSLIALALLVFFEKNYRTVNQVFIVPAVVSALWFVFRSSPQLLMLNAGVLLLSLYAWVRFGTLTRFLGGSWRYALLASFETWVAEWAVAPIEVGLGSRSWLASASRNNRQTALMQAFLRGCLITVPIVLVFGVLLSSADVVFGDLMSDAFGWFKLDNLDSLVGQLIVIGFFTWLSVVAFKLMLLGPISGVAGDLAQVNLMPGKGYLLSMIEAGMLLVSVNGLFLLFVGIQAQYFFGGKENITERGYTYADYARRGFFELLAVSIMTMLLVLFLAAVTKREGVGERLFQGLSTGIILLTGVMLVSAFQRLSLYEEAYGYTRLRVVSHAFTVWLGVLFVILLVELLLKKRWFWMGCVVVGFGYLLTLNVLNVDAFIAEHNVSRFEDTGKIDIDYLHTLSYDAVPAMVKLLDEYDYPDRYLLLTGLGNWLYELDQYHDEHTPFEYHLGKQQAWEALDAHRQELKDYIQPEYRYGFMD